MDRAYRGRDVVTRSEESSCMAVNVPAGLTQIRSVSVAGSYLEVAAAVGVVDSSFHFKFGSASITPSLTNTLPPPTQVAVTILSLFSARASRTLGRPISTPWAMRQ